jgi:hypothetical protein
MPKGLTYPTRDQAETVAGDYITSGLVSKIKQLPSGEWQVLIEPGLRQPTTEEIKRTAGILTVEEEEEEEINKGIRSKRIAQRIEKKTRLSSEEEINKALKEAERKLAVKKALEKTPEAVEEAFLIKRKQVLEKTIEERKARGRTPGIIVPIYDKQTNKIINYKLETDLSGEQLEKRARELTSKVIDTPLQAGKFVDTMLRKSVGDSRNLNWQSTIQGHGVNNPGSISNMQRPKIGTTGAVGIEKPAIAKVSKPDLDSVKIQTEGTVKAEPKAKEKSIYSGTPYLKDKVD